MEGEKRVIMKNGRSATSGTCTVCGTKMFKIGGGGKTTVAKAKTASKKPAKKAAKTKPKKKKR